ncbi:MAG: hypothetical protein GY870_20440, partial [archaeon]|nr:hypothetical protein [archaeon]
MLELLKELEIDWELIFFRRRLAIHDWTEIECDRNPENLKKYLRTKYNNLNYFDLNNIIRIVVKNELPFIVADKMASLLFKMKAERTQHYKIESEQQYDLEFNRKTQIEEERADLINKINVLRRQKQIQASKEIVSDLKSSRDRKNDLDNDKRRVVEKLRILRDKIDNPEDVYSVSLKKAEIAASAKLACAYLGIDKEITFDRDISVAEIIKYQEE